MSKRWEDVDRVWHAVLARPESERSAAVTQLCADEPSLRHEVESLLMHMARASAAGFGDAPIGVPQRARDSWIGRTFGPYSVHTLLGVGGMGEVFQARDSILDREVALKFLPDLWLADPERTARFDREARVLASINHPNVGSIYGVEDSDGVRALVLELVEGETLAERLARRRLPIGDVTDLAAQIVDALEAAHERGIVHRDLKPANIKITPQGRLKVLDFGLALAGGEAGSEAGALIGTPAYMSPEQACGMPVDSRTDIWSFGCVLYEMLAGTQAFSGDDVGEVLGRVIQGEPDWSRLPAETPASLRACLRRCLEREPTRRLHHVEDIRLALGSAPPARSASTAWVVGGVVAAVLAIAAVVLLMQQVPGREAPATASANPPVLVTPKIGGGGTATTRTIQEAIDLGVRGATVSVLPGTYPERLTIRRGMTIQATGERSGAVILAPPGTPETVIEIATTDPVVIRGLTVQARGKHAIRAVGAVNLTVEGSTISAVDPPLELNPLVLVSNDAGATGGRARAAIRRNVIDGSIPPLPPGVQRPQNLGVQLAGDLDGVFENNQVRRFGAICVAVDTRADFGGHTNVEILNNEIDECRPAGRVAAIKVGSLPVGVLSPKEPTTATGTVNILGNTIRNSSEDCLNTAISFNVFAGRIERNRIINFVKPCARQNPRNMPGAIWLGLRLTGLTIPPVVPTVRFNDIHGNAHAGLRVGPDQKVAADVSCNYWGSPQGPSGIGRGSGDAIVVEAGAPAPRFAPVATTPIAQTTRTSC